MSTENDTSRRGLDLAFGTSFLATMAVAVAPSFVTFGFLVWSRPDPRPVLACLISLVATAIAFAGGAKVWESQPESHGYSFADLMLWHWVRREWAEEKLVRNARMLGYDRQGRFVGKDQISPEKQLFAAREIGAALDAKSSYTLNHSKRVEKHVRDVAAVLGLSEKDTEQLATAAALHDIGNIRIPEHVIRKAGELTVEERSTIEGSVLLGALMAFEAGGEPVVQGLRHHHERWDGRGYPNGLKGEEIPLFARIIGVAEAYDAMTSTRPYRQSLTQDQAVAILRDEAGSQFDPRIVEAFASTLPEPILIIERFPMLAWAQRQIRELSILFRRVGGTAVSAAASTIAIALILGTALLKPDVFSGDNAPDRGRHERRMIAEGNPQNASDAERIKLASEAEPYSGEGVVVAEELAAAGTNVIDEAEVLGERISIEDVDHGDDGGNGGDDDGGSDGGGNGNGGGGDGGEEPGGGSGGGGTDPDVVTNPGGGSGSPGGGTDPEPSVDSDKPGKGNGRGNGNGHGKPDHVGGKGNGKGHGKPDHAGGPGNGNGHGKPDHAGGNGNGKPDHAGGPGNGNGNAGADHGNDGSPGNDNPNAGGANGNGPKAEDGWAESGGNGNGNGNPGGGNDDGEDGGNSSSPGSDGGSGDAGDSPGNSGNAPGHSDDKGPDKEAGSGSSSDSSSGDSGSDGPGNSENSNGKDKNGDAAV